MEWPEVQAYLDRVGQIVGSPVELFYRGRKVTQIYEVVKNALNTSYMVQTAGLNPRWVSQFTLTPFPGCCAFLISTNVHVRESYRNRGINTILNKLRQDIARHWGYTTLVCTDVKNNDPQRKVLVKNGWKDVYEVKNRRTTNDVFISVKELY